MKINTLHALISEAIVAIDLGAKPHIEYLQALRDAYFLQCWNNTQASLNLSRILAGKGDLESALYSFRDLPIVKETDLYDLVWAIWHARSFVKSEIIDILDKLDAFNSKRRNVLASKYIKEVEDEDWS